MRRLGPQNRHARKIAAPEWAHLVSDSEQKQRRLAALSGESLANIGLCSRTVNCLEERDIYLIGSMAVMTREELLGIKNFGENAIAECDELFTSLGIEHPEWRSPTTVKRLHSIK